MRSVPKLRRRVLGMACDICRNICCQARRSHNEYVTSGYATTTQGNGELTDDSARVAGDNFVTPRLRQRAECNKTASAHQWGSVWYLMWSSCNDFATTGHASMPYLLTLSKGWQLGLILLNHYRLNAPVKSGWRVAMKRFVVTPGYYTSPRTRHS